ncbi:MAG TPA: prepilin-type N-terminal cleavage/methylation domain-containing protein [Phycisphaerae bacterium]|nr:prepilin-type N-terminal cleavage/methylation domain-containing protein [Phycisphaerales bacterium]HRX84399.1 prepilin-type N-terminal cleavage/methylation domain-containing protein [Phycisphaerae bacterium]
MSTRRQHRFGFTLLEILIVVIVIGILAAIVIPQMSSASENAKVSKVLQIVDTLRTATQAYYADTSRLAIEYSNSTDPTERQLSIKQDTLNWKGPYLTHPLADGDNPYGGIVRVYNDFTSGPVHPVGFDLIGSGTDSAIGAGQWVMFTQIPEGIAREVDATIDRGVGGVWSNTGRVEWQNDTLLIFLMDIND